MEEDWSVNSDIIVNSDCTGEAGEDPDFSEEEDE